MLFAKADVFIFIALLTIQIQLWDTAGVERTGRMTNTYFNLSHGVILMYSINDKVSLERLNVWYENSNTYGNTNTQYFVVGNKNDLSSGEVDVTEEYALQMAQDRFGIPGRQVFRVSAKTGQGLEEMLIEISRVLSETVQPVEPDPFRIPPIIHDSEECKKSRCCSST